MVMNGFAVAEYGPRQSLEPVITHMKILEAYVVNRVDTLDERFSKDANHLKELQRTLLQYERELLSSERSKKWMAQSLSFSESVRRLCAYSRDFGEILLNLKISTEMVRVHRKV